jgi:glycosyltransferase involved in cell wall biosynthesis
MLSILIPTVEKRRPYFEKLLGEMKRQAEPWGDDIEILFHLDNKEMPLGEKRMRLYQRATKEYSVQWDDDDWIHPDGIRIIMEQLKYDCDCITYRWYFNLDGKPHIRNFGLQYDRVYEDGRDGYHQVSAPNPKCPIKTSIARKIGDLLPDFGQLRYAEDAIFSETIYPYLKTERHIDDLIYLYIGMSNEKWDPDRYGMKHWPKKINRLI